MVGVFLVPSPFQGVGMAGPRSLLEGGVGMSGVCPGVGTHPRHGTWHRGWVPNPLVLTSSDCH